MTTIQIDLPDATAQAARDAGLLTSWALERLILDALRRRQAAERLLTVADSVSDAGIEPMPMEDIGAEIKAVRTDRRTRAAAN
ncbi:hypothetical protein [Methylomagnum sp.]